eukprot:g930.t1
MRSLELAVLLLAPALALAYCNAMGRMGYGPRTNTVDFRPGWNGLAKTPPRGWRSWYAYYTGGQLNQATLTNVIDALVAKNRTVAGWDGPVSLCELGYCSAGIDEGYEGCGLGVNGTQHYVNGTPAVNPSKFPDMKGLVNYGHSHGVKMGLYFNGCGCIEKRMPASGWDIDYKGDMRLLHDLGFDAQSGKAYEIENCHWGDCTGDDASSCPTQDWCPFNFYRTSGDSDNGLGTWYRNLQSTVRFQSWDAPVSQPGCWAYPDMLQAGRLGCPDGGHTSGCAVPTPQLLNWTRAHFAAFAIVSSPLVLSIHPSDENLEPLLDIIGNKRAIEVSEAWAAHPGTLLRTLPPAVPPAPPVAPGRAAVSVARNSSDATQSGWRYDAATNTIRHKGDADEEELCLSTDGKDVPCTLTQCGNASTVQNFTLDAAAGGLFRVMAPAGGARLYPFCLQSAGGTKVGKVDVYSCTGSAGQKFAADAAAGTLCAAGGTACLAARSSYDPPPAGPAGVQWWAKPLGAGRAAALFINGGALPYRANVTMAELNVTAAATATDVWSGGDAGAIVGGVYDTGVVEPMDSRFLSLAVLLANARANAVQNRTRVHVVAHSHDDPGWLVTADEYYDTEVHRLLDAAVASLLANRTRIFHYVEMVYFSRWWSQQSAALQAQVRGLVAQGRLVFLTGGLCMNDEAGTHHGAIIDQMTWGHRFINDTFGPRALPTVSWQIDPYGHSAGYAALSRAMGLDAFVGQKINQQVHDARAAARELEFEWLPPAGAGAGAGTDAANGATPDAMLGHLLYDNTAGYSFGFKFPVNGSSAVQRAAGLVATSVYTRLGRYRHPGDVLFLYGNDFAFQDAPAPFEAMEAVMAFVNSRPAQFNFTLAYSTPARYFEAVRAAASAGGANALPRFRGDLFVTTFAPHYVRTGYYASRAAEKAADRALWSAAHAASALGAWHALGRGAELDRALQAATALADAAVGIHQHHDAITGTDLLVASRDYRRRLSNATALLAGPAAAAAAVAAGAPITAAAGATGCPERNVSVCGATRLAGRRNVSMYVFNPLCTGGARDAVLDVPVPVATVAVVDARTGAPVRSEVHAALLRDAERGAPYTLFVAADALAPLEVRALVIIPCATCGPVPLESARAGETVALEVGGGAAAAIVDGGTGALSRVGDAAVVSSLAYYEPYMGHNGSSRTADACASAYAFRPTAQAPATFLQGSARVRASRGKIVQQTHAVIRPARPGAGAVELVARADAVRGVQLLWGLGPLDVSNGAGQEVVLRVAAPAVRSAGAFHTDANGLALQPRARREGNTYGYTLYEAVAENMYPATSIAALRDARGGGRPGLALTFDAAHAVSSPRDGTLELLLHRRHVDHGCREDEGFELDDQSRVVGAARVLVAPGDALAAAYRPAALHSLHPPTLGFSAAPAAAAAAAAAGQTQAQAHARQQRQRQRRGATRPPPPAIELPLPLHLHTLKRLGESELRCDPFGDVTAELCLARRGTRAAAAAAARTAEVLLVRLQHLFHQGEDDALSMPASANLTALLSPRWRVVNVDETALSAGRVLQRDVGSGADAVHLQPGQIRSFVVTAHPAAALFTRSFAFAQ